MVGVRLEKVSKAFGGTRILSGLDPEVGGRRVSRPRRALGMRKVDEDPGPRRAPLEVRVAMVGPLGHEVIVHGLVGAPPGTAMAARVAPARPPESGTTLTLHAEVAALQLFDAETGGRLAA